MEYYLVGKIYPERAPISLEFDTRGVHHWSGREFEIHVSIILNQIPAWMKTKEECDEFYIRNSLLYILWFLDGLRLQRRNKSDIHVG